MLRWRDLVHLSDAKLEAFDVAEVNLACAVGLPDADKIDHAECINRLNHYAWCSNHYTGRRMAVFRKKPEKYEYSEPLFRVVCMMTLLWKELGIRYNPAKIPVDVPFDTADTFIHGAILGEGGTCATLPVVYAAVGRRLGYPLRLVACKKHLFVRWEEQGGIRFNIEVNDTGTSTPPDAHYRRERYVVGREIEQAYCHLQTMTPRGELAHFLAQRGCRLLDVQMHQESVEAFTWAARLAPAHKGFQNCVKAVLSRWEKSVQRGCGATRTLPNGLEPFV